MVKTGKYSVTHSILDHALKYTEECNSFGTWIGDGSAIFTVCLSRKSRPYAVILTAEYATLAYTKHYAIWVHEKPCYLGTQNTMLFGYTKHYAIWVHKTLLCKKTAGCSCQPHGVTSGWLTFAEISTQKPTVVFEHTTETNHCIWTGHSNQQLYLNPPQKPTVVSEWTTETKRCIWTHLHNFPVLLHNHAVELCVAAGHHRLHLHSNLRNQLLMTQKQNRKG